MLYCYKASGQLGTTYKRELRHQATVTSPGITELDKEEATALRYTKQKKKCSLSCISTNQVLTTPYFL